LRFCSNPPRPEAFADTAMRWRIIMAMGWRVCSNVPRPEAFADQAALRTLLYLQVMFFAAKKIYFVYLKSRLLLLLMQQ